MTPTLIIVHGLPATGKTSISKKIAEELKLPWISKDVYKERIFEILHPASKDVEFSRKLGAASSELIYIVVADLLQKGISCVAENYYFHAFAEPAFKRMIEESGATLVQIFTTCSHDERSRRFEERAHTERHPAHMDIERIRSGDERIKSDSDSNRPLDIDSEIIEVDTTNFKSVDMVTIIRRIKTLMHPHEIEQYQHTPPATS